MAQSVVKFKTMFFDRPKVLAAVSDATRRNLVRIGGRIRVWARSSIKTRKSVSSPGSPPHGHTGTLRRFIFFGYDDSKRSVVIGPAKTNQVFFGNDRKPVTGTIPEVLEYGGEITVLEKRLLDGSWVRADLRSRRRLAEYQTRYRTVKIKARPFMNPALRDNLAFINSVWANSVIKKSG